MAGLSDDIEFFHAELMSAGCSGGIRELGRNARARKDEESENTKRRAPGNAEAANGRRCENERLAPAFANRPRSQYFQSRKGSHDQGYGNPDRHEHEADALRWSIGGFPTVKASEEYDSAHGNVKQRKKHPEEVGGCGDKISDP